MPTTWKKVLTEADVAADVGQSVADNETGLVTGNAVFDYIQAQNYGTGGGDIELVAQGNGIETSGTSAFTTIADVTSGDAYIRVKEGSGIVVDSNGVNIDFSGVAGDGISGAGDVFTIGGGDGITVGGSAIAVTIDDNTINYTATGGSGAIQVKDGGVTFAKLSTGAFNDSTVSSVSTADTQLLTAGAVATFYPNVTLDGGTGSLNYITIDSTNPQQLNLGEVDVYTDTNLSGGSSTNIQGALDLTLSAQGVLNGVAYSLGTTSDVTFADINSTGDITGTGNLTINGNVQLGNAVTDTVTIAGDLIVEGNTVTLDVATLTVEDKNITLANNSTTIAGGAKSGISVSTSSTASYHPGVQWNSATRLTGWGAENHNSSRTQQGDDIIPIAVMNVESQAPTSSNDAAGEGSLWYDTTGDTLYIRTE